jgi:hypothetical protein
MVALLEPTQPPANGHKMPPPNGKTFAVGNHPKIEGRKLSKLQQLTEIQRLLLQDIQNMDTKPSDRSSCARAFEVIEERLRIVRGKFKAGDIRASDLDPVRLAWTVKRFSQANRKTLRGLPGMQSAIAIEAEVVEKPQLKLNPSNESSGIDKGDSANLVKKNRSPDLLPGDVTP